MHLGSSSLCDFHSCSLLGFTSPPPCSCSPHSCSPCSGCCNQASSSDDPPRSTIGLLPPHPTYLGMQVVVACALCIHLLPWGPLLLLLLLLLVTVVDAPLPCAQERTPHSQRSAAQHCPAQVVPGSGSPRSQPTRLMGLMGS